MPVTRISNGEYDNFIHIVLEGKLNQEDYTRELIPWFDEACSDNNTQVNVLVDCRELTGFSILAMFEDKKMAIHYRDCPIKYALVVQEGGVLQSVCSNSLFQYTAKFAKFDMGVFITEEEGMNWLFGSESEKVDLSIKKISSMNDMKLGSGKKFLIAIDGGVNSVQSLADAIELMDVENDEIHLLSIYSQGNFFSKLKASSEYQKTREEAEENLNHAKSLILGEMNEEDLAINLHLLECDNPKKQIIDLANELSVNYIVLGNSKSSFSKSILGRVSTYVLNHAKCTVIISKDIEEEQGNNNND
eukprot:TRINITY_DN1093_c0_g5_i1.p1 TRINITY_DN1093_c0_g5~~TRINITY_DN1093_c0_g5_i1.p1  ORF type:complete len:303 (-),score=91.68 TRINITY_DN1093_c0_g5_i1:60-968(-)